jgi:imidazolonepropionase-like amidohydrolase
LTGDAPDIVRGQRLIEGVAGAARLALCALFALASPACWAASWVEQSLEPEAIVITNVSVFQPDGSWLEAQDVWLGDGRISFIGPTGGLAIPETLPTLDGSGHYLMPGLIDVHVHLYSGYTLPGRLSLPDPRTNLEQLLGSGVTTVLDLATSAKTIAKIHKRLDSGRWEGPTVYSTGRPFTAPMGHPLSSVRAIYPSLLVRWVTSGIAIQVGSPDEAEAAMAARPNSGFVKLMLDDIPEGTPLLSDQTLGRLVELAHEGGERAVAHVGAPDDVDRALDAGVDALLHGPPLAAISEAQAERMATANVPMAPTLTVWQRIHELQAATLESDPLTLRGLTARQAKELADYLPNQQPFEGPMGDWANKLLAGQHDRLETITRLHEAGATILMGSDSPGLALAPGAGTLLELDLLVAAGLSPTEVLVAATWTNSRFLDVDARFGAIHEGWEADLLLLTGPPTEDLSVLEEPTVIWSDGRRVRPLWGDQAD